MKPILNRQRAENGISRGAHNFGFGKQPPDTIYEASDCAVAITCPTVGITFHAFDDIIAECQGNAVGRYFLMIRYDFQGTAWTAYAPARYINFPNKDLHGDRYLQPISGCTLFHNGSRFVIAYVAANLRQGSCHIEFITREPIGFLGTKTKTGRIYKLLRPFQFVLDQILRTGEFCKVYPVRGEVSFFTCCAVRR